jgi:cell division ATPase FtsA
MEAFKRNIDLSLADAEKMTAEPTTHIYLGVSGVHIEVSRSTGIVAVPGTEVTEDDI